jgi:hypothetical protein
LRRGVNTHPAPYITPAATISGTRFIEISVPPALEEGATKPAEHVIPLDELDLQKTIDVNTRRGFRVVLRDKLWQQYLKNHPDLTPPDLAPPQKD